MREFSFFREGRCNIRTLLRIKLRYNLLDEKVLLPSRVDLGSGRTGPETVELWVEGAK